MCVLLLMFRLKLVWLPLSDVCGVCDGFGDVVMVVVAVCVDVLLVGGFDDAAVVDVVCVVAGVLDGASVVGGGIATDAAYVCVVVG